MKKIIIFGNSGSGKSTLAKQYVADFSLAHLDLDSLAWQNINPPQRRKLKDSIKDLKQFLSDNENWVIEGCYADLLSSIINYSTNLIFINPGTEICIANCKSRPWEPHKYKSKEAQDANLCMLIDWIKQYNQRTDEFSLIAHRDLFDRFSGNKKEYTSNQRN